MDQVHHGCLDFHEVTCTKELSQVVNNLVASLEDLAHRAVHNQVKVALSVADLLAHDNLFFSGFILAVVGLGEHVHAVRKLDNIVGLH